MAQLKETLAPTEMKDRIRGIRKENHLSQVELAKKLGVSQSVISLIESGHASVSIEILKRMSEQFDLSCDWLIYGKERYTRLSLNNSFIPLISPQAEAGYISRHSDLDYMSSLELYKLPDFQDGNFRIFLVDSDSMVPSMHPHDKIVCEKIDHPDLMIEGTMNVLVTKSNILVKRVYFWEQDRNYLVLKSDNRHYTEERISMDAILELWAVRAKITNSFVEDATVQNKRMDSLERDLSAIKGQVEQLLNQSGKASKTDSAILDSVTDLTTKEGTGKFSEKKNPT